MTLIIDGYNFLHGANIVAEGPGAYTLEKSRRSLLRFVASVVPKSKRSATTVVFDGKEAPPGLSRVGEFAGIQVMFSEPGTEADDLIEELILADSAPRRLLVVSSDHRIQRAAARRQAKSIDSEVWYHQQRPSPDAINAELTRETDADAAGPSRLTEAEVADWLSEFGEFDVADIQNEIDTAERRRPASKPAGDSPKPVDETEADQDSPSDEKPTDNFNPFPDGYGEDLLE